MRRTVTINFADNFAEATQETKNEVERAIGYLSLWAYGSPNKSNVVINCGRYGDISARYTDASNQTTYEILAQRRPDGTYSYHS